MKTIRLMIENSKKFLTAYVKKGDFRRNFEAISREKDYLSGANSALLIAGIITLEEEDQLYKEIEEMLNEVEEMVEE